MGSGIAARQMRAGSSLVSKINSNSPHKVRLRKASLFAVEALEARQLLTSTWTNLSNVTANWDVNSNWSPTTAYPNASSAVATMHVATTVNQTISLGANITVGSLTLGSSSTSHYSQTIASGNTLTFNNGSSAATLTLTGTAPVTLACDITLGQQLNHYRSFGRDADP